MLFEAMVLLIMIQAICIAWLVGCVMGSRVKRGQASASEPDGDESTSFLDWEQLEPGNFDSLKALKARAFRKTDQLN